MYRTLISLTVAAAVLAGGAAALAQGPTPTPAQTIVLSVPFKDVGMKFIDRKPKGDSTGDHGIDYARLVDPSTHAGRGYMMQSCDLAKLGRRELSWCSGGLQLAGGAITFGLAGVEGHGATTYAITGGTGAYATARGTVTTAAGKSALTVTVEIMA